MHPDPDRITELNTEHGSTGGAPHEGRPSSSKKRWGRKLGATLVVVGLLGLAISAPVLFDVSSDDPGDGDRSRPSRVRRGEPNVYSSLLTNATRCRPEPGDFTSPGGSDSVRAIARDVERLRDLRFSSPPEVEFMTPGELQDHVVDTVRAEIDREAFQLQLAALAKLKVIPEGFDLDALIAGTSGQILGLYDPETERLLVGGSGSFGALEQLTIAHELDHALTDQVLGLPDLEGDDERADAQLAERALVEGDASLLMQFYGMVEFPNDLSDLVADSVGDDLGKTEPLPHLLQRSLEFPYVEGYAFACELFASNGWAALDRAYTRLPRSTLEILYPGLFRSIEIVQPPPGKGPGPAWTQAHTSSLGAADLQWLFEAPGGEATGNRIEAAGQVSRWRGGRFEVWTKEDQIVVVLAIEEGRDLAGSGSSSICHRLARWYTASDPEATFLDARGAVGAWSAGDDVAVVDCRNGSTRFVIAPNLSVALRVARV